MSRLGIVYHMPFWQSDDGSLWEAEGSFGRYVDSLAPYFDEISLCVPVRPTPAPEGTRLRVMPLPPGSIVIEPTLPPTTTVISA